MSPSYPRSAPFVMARGEGAVVEDVDGNVYLDCCAGIAVAATGHSHPDVVRAITEQASRFLHISTDYYHEPQVALGEAARRASRPSAGARRRFSRTREPRPSRPPSSWRGITPRRFNIIAFLGSFHGRTLGSLALTSSRTVQRRGFGPMAPGVFHAPYAESRTDARSARRDAASCARECLAYIENQILTHLVSPDEVAAIIVEPIQGEGGYIVPPPEFIQGLAAIAAQARHAARSPTRCSRASGARERCSPSSTPACSPTSSSPRRESPPGMPMGVTIAREDVMDWPVGAHSNTFGGNPVACAAALATIKLVRERPDAERRRRRCSYLRERSRSWPSGIASSAMCAGAG